MCNRSVWSSLCVCQGLAPKATGALAPCTFRWALQLALGLRVLTPPSAITVGPRQWQTHICSICLLLLSEHFHCVVG